LPTFFELELEVLRRIAPVYIFDPALLAIALSVDEVAFFVVDLGMEGGEEKEEKREKYGMFHWGKIWCVDCLE
jgi:hypothetical protein